MKRKFFWLTLYAISMAYLETTVVVYLRELYYPENPLQIFPLKILEIFRTFNILIELGREVATVIMMLSVAFLVERKNTTRIFAAFIYQFGIWDIFYYVWLKVTIGWPLSFTEWDILFLIPLVWLGPWICPVLISLLFVVWSGWTLLSNREIRLTKFNIVIFLVGAIIGLISFLQPAFPVLQEGGLEIMQHYEPGNFWWGLFIPGYILMVAGLLSSLVPIKSPG